MSPSLVHRNYSSQKSRYVNRKFHQAHQRSKHRIVFALRGFVKTYQFPDPRIQALLGHILIHHDVSGRYPTSAPDYRQEEVVLRAARKPLDEPEDILRQWLPSTPIDSSDVEMNGDQEDEEDNQEVEEEDEEDRELDEGLDVHT